MVRSTTRQRWSRSQLRRDVFQSAGGVTFSQDAIRLLIGTKAVIENTIAKAHKMADVTREFGKRPD